ncbi:MAG: CBS domain-containing protein [Peptococcaceae bacterium]
MTTLREIMTPEVITITPLDSVAKAESLMRHYRFGGLPVIENGTLVGIITSRDIRGSNVNRLVIDVMTKNPVTVHPDASLWLAKELMEKNLIERLPVVKNNIMVGVVTKNTLYTTLAKYTDSLTNLPKAEYFFQEAIDLLRQGQEIAIIFIDLDDFGCINKEVGHEKGNYCLCKAATLLKTVVPEKACLCRYAGDEFILVLPGNNLEAQALAYRLSEAIASVELPGVKLSASIGIAGGRRSSLRINDLRATVSDLVNLASLASTRAKRENKQMVIASGWQVAEN